MDFKEFVEKEMAGKELNEAVNFSVDKVNDLADKLSKMKFDKKLSEDSVKVLAYLAHIQAAGFNYDKAARTLKKNEATMNTRNNRNVLMAYEIPDELWWRERTGNSKRPTKETN